MCGVTGPDVIRNEQILRGSGVAGVAGKKMDNRLRLYG